MAATNSDRAASGLVLLLALAVFGVVAVFTIATSGGFSVKDARASDYQRGWDAAASAYRGDYARGVADGQHRDLVAHCIGPMEAPSE